LLTSLSSLLTVTYCRKTFELQTSRISTFWYWESIEDEKKKEHKQSQALQLAENYFSWITLKSTAGNWFTTSSNVNKPSAVSSTSPEQKVFNTSKCCTSDITSQNVQWRQSFRNYIFTIKG